MYRSFAPTAAVLPTRAAPGTDLLGLVLVLLLATEIRLVHFQGSDERPGPYLRCLAEPELPDPIPDTPENIMKAFIKTPPRKRVKWKFVQERDKKQAP